MLIVFSPRADEELERAQQIYEARWRGLGDAFLDEVARALRHLATFPDAAQKIDAECRRAVLRRFPFVLIYRERRGVVEVVSVFPSRSNPARLRLSSELFH